MILKKLHILGSKKLIGVESVFWIWVFFFLLWYFLPWSTSKLLWRSIQQAGEPYGKLCIIIIIILCAIFSALCLTPDTTVVTSSSRLCLVICWYNLTVSCFRAILTYLLRPFLYILWYQGGEHLLSIHVCATWKCGWVIVDMITSE